MEGIPQRRSPAVRDRHGKRLPQRQGQIITEDGVENDPVLSLPITVTVVQTISPTTSSTTANTSTVTVFVPPTISNPVSSLDLSSSLTLIGSPLSQGVTQSSSSATSINQAPTPSASANNSGNKTDSTSQSDTSVSRGIPTGSIIGIVVVVVVILIAAIVFLVRKRSVRNRMRMRGGWANKGTMGPSFLWIEPGEKTSGVFAGAQAPNTTSKFPYIPPPAPPRPPPAHGTDNPDFVSSTPSALGLSIPTALVPGRKATPSAYPSSPAFGGYASLSPESATVRSTFIPTLPDELSITTGEVVRIASVYDDGWALCSNAQGELGMVPLECLDRGIASQVQQEGREYRNMSRVSSLAASPRPYGGTTMRY
ncbi:hypothetical protein BDZ94DRAFT_1244311 [Collybia nuda]|uniref:SH3 domain-containing protein n=1 Tax=Collybia nuda TaxID=64659 RepID=A0A9P5YIN5_9AGAR|nr:hypothetical protein BDZ94DRAFT_1244311 [Collybia nuda]